MAPYVQRYFDQVEDVWNRRTSELAQNMVSGHVPELGVGDRPGHRRRGRRSSSTAADLPFALRRLVSEGRADVVRALRARATDSAAG